MKLFRFGCVVLLVLCMWCSLAVAAEKGKVPFKVLSSEELKALIEQNPPGLVVVDSLSVEICHT